MNTMPGNIVPSSEVHKALEEGLPIVALESTVLTHGLPYPQNLEVFHTLEEILRGEKVTPATIIVLDGVAHIGLDEGTVEMLESRLRAGYRFEKLGMRDLGLASAKSASGGTTVSATMKLASLSGIEIFATGGIGGVHRDWERTLDMSSDLSALATLTVAVVSAGCKAILDVPATLEYLETLAVPVWGWQTDRFPLFYTSSSEHPIARIDTPEEFATAWQRHWELGGKGVLVANPIPASSSLPSGQINPQIEAALAEARSRNICGKALTPFLLDFLARRTKGASVTANLELLQNNVRLAARLATALQDSKEAR